MRFQFTLNMPAHSGSLVHQVLGEHPADSLQAMLRAMESVEFVIVEEYYRVEGKYQSVGNIAINPLMVGKIKVWTQR